MNENFGNFLISIIAITVTLTTTEGISRFQAIENDFTELVVLARSFHFFQLNVHPQDLVRATIVGPAVQHQLCSPFAPLLFSATSH